VQDLAWAAHRKFSMVSKTSSPGSHLSADSLLYLCNFHHLFSHDFPISDYYCDYLGYISKMAKDAAK